MSQPFKFYWLHYDSRSGSTFLAQKLTSQFSLYSPPEVNFISKVVKYFDEFGLSQQSRVHIIKLICKDPKHLDWLLDEDLLNALFEKLNDSSTFSDLLSLLLSPLLEKIEDQPEVILLKKKYLSVVPIIDKLLPQSRHFILVRDGRAVMHSKLSSIKSTTQRPFTTSVIKASIKWKSVIDHYHRLSAQENVFLIRYEDMITNTDYLNAFAKQHNLKARDNTNSQKYLLPERYNYGLHENIDKPADPSILDKWKDKCPPARVKLYEFLTKNYLTKNGYDLQYRPSWLYAFYLFADIGRLISEMAKDAKRKI